jgi:hypothetical protein
MSQIKTPQQQQEEALRNYPLISELIFVQKYLRFINSVLGGEVSPKDKVYSKSDFFGVQYDSQGVGKASLKSITAISETKNIYNLDLVVTNVDGHPKTRVVGKVGSKVNYYVHPIKDVVFKNKELVAIYDLNLIGTFSDLVKFLSHDYFKQALSNVSYLGRRGVTAEEFINAVGVNHQSYLDNTTKIQSVGIALASKEGEPEVGFDRLSHKKWSITKSKTGAESSASMNVKRGELVFFVEGLSLLDSNMSRADRFKLSKDEKLTKSAESKKAEFDVNQMNQIIAVSRANRGEVKVRSKTNGRRAPGQKRETLEESIRQFVSAGRPLTVGPREDKPGSKTPKSFGTNKFKSGKFKSDGKIRLTDDKNSFPFYGIFFSQQKDAAKTAALYKNIESLYRLFGFFVPDGMKDRISSGGSTRIAGQKTTSNSIKVNFGPAVKPSFQLPAQLPAQPLIKLSQNAYSPMFGGARVTPTTTSPVVAPISNPLGRVTPTTFAQSPTPRSSPQECTTPQVAATGSSPKAGGKVVPGLSRKLVGPK